MSLVGAVIPAYLLGDKTFVTLITGVDKVSKAIYITRTDSRNLVTTQMQVSVDRTQQCLHNWVKNVDSPRLKSHYGDTVGTHLHHF